MDKLSSLTWHLPLQKIPLHTIMLFVCHPKILHKHRLQFLLGVKMARRETENNAYAKFWDDKQRVLWYVMVFSGVVNCDELPITLMMTRTTMLTMMMLTMMKIVMMMMMMMC